MRCARHPDCCSHARNFHGAHHTPQITHIGLYDINSTHADHSPPGRYFAVLFTAGDIQAKRLRDRPRLLQLPVWAGFFKMLDAVLLEHLPHFNRPGGGKTTVGINQ